MLTPDRQGNAPVWKLLDSEASPPKCKLTTRKRQAPPKPLLPSWREPLGTLATRPPSKPTDLTGELVVKSLAGNPDTPPPDNDIAEVPTFPHALAPGLTERLLVLTLPHEKLISFTIHIEFVLKTPGTHPNPPRAKSRSLILLANL